MWPFQRKTEAPADSGSRPAPAPVIRRDWTGLPPIQRLIGAHPLTAPSDRFSNDLATHHDPSVSTEPMGHHVSAEAPAGLVLALARPTTRNDGPAMISRPRVQRRAQSVVEESGEWDGDEAAPPATRPSPLPAGTPPSAVIELPAVAPMPAIQRLTTLSPEVEPMPVETAPRRPRLDHSPDLPGARRAEPAAEPVAAAPRLTLGQARRLGLGAPINRVPDRPLQRTTAETTAMPPSLAEPGVPFAAPPSRTPSIDLPLAPREPASTPQSDPPPPGGRGISTDPPANGGGDNSAESLRDSPPPATMDTLANVLVQRGRETSAEPLPVRPIVERISDHHRPAQGTGETSDNNMAPLPAPVQRTAASDPAPQGGKALSVDSMPLYTPPRPSPAGGEGDFRESSPAREGDDFRQALPATSGGDFRESSTPVSSEIDFRQRSAIGAEGAGLAPFEVPVWSAPTRPSAASWEGAELAPLVGARPLRPTTLQRAAEPTPVTGTADPPAAQSLAHPDDVILPSSHGSNGSLGGVLTRSQFSQGLSNAAPQPSESRTLREQPLAVGRRLPVQARSEPPISRAPDFPLAPVQRTAAAVSPEPDEPGGESTSEVVQRAWFDSVSSELGSLSSRAPSAAEAGSPVGAVGSAVGSMFGGHHAAETDMDELAGKLYDKIRTRLKS